MDSDVESNHYEECEKVGGIYLDGLSLNQKALHQVLRELLVGKPSEFIKVSHIQSAL